MPPGGGNEGCMARPERPPPRAEAPPGRRRPARPKPPRACTRAGGRRGAEAERGRAGCRWGRCVRAAGADPALPDGGTDSDARGPAPVLGVRRALACVHREARTAARPLALHGTQAGTQERASPRYVCAERLTMREVGIARLYCRSRFSV